MKNPYHLKTVFCCSHDGFKHSEALQCKKLEDTIHNLKAKVFFGKAHFIVHHYRIQIDKMLQNTCASFQFYFGVSNCYRLQKNDYENTKSCEMKGNKISLNK